MIEIIFIFMLFASAITANKMILETLPPTFFIAIRMLGSGAILYIYNIYLRSTHIWPHYFKRDLWSILTITASTTFIPVLCKAYALKHLFSSKAALLGSLDPFVTAIFAYIWWGEKLNRYGVFGICLGFLGSLILILTTSSTEETVGSWWIFSLPEIAAVSAVVISRYGWINIQKIVTREHYTPSEINSLMMLCGGGYALILAYAKHEVSMAYFQWPITGLLIYTIIIGNVIGYTMLGHFLKQYSVTTVSLAGLSVPLFVQLFGTLYLHEPLNPVFFIAFGCMGIGLYVFQKTRKL